MKLLITCVSLCMTSIFYISKANTDFFILVDPRIQELQSGKKWIPTTYFRGKGHHETKTICEKLKKAKTFIAERPMVHEPTNDNEYHGTSNNLESNFFLNEDWDSRTNETVLGKVTTAELLFHDQKIKTHVITCEFGKSEKDKIYVARQRDSKHLFLFGKTKTDETDYDTIPEVLAIGMNYILIQTVEQNIHIEKVIWQYIHQNGKAKSNRLAKKLFEEDGVDIFQLCASITFHEESKEDKSRKYKYIITIPGPQNNLSTEVPVNNIVKFIPDNYGRMSVKLLTCRIKQKADNKYPIKFKFSIAPDIGKRSESRIFAMFDYLNNSKVTKVNNHYTLFSPWKFVNLKHPRSEEETEN